MAVDASLRRRRVILWSVGILSVLAVVAVTALVVTGQPEFCRTCHLMETRYVSWHRSTHAAEADCLDCHAQPGTIGEIRAHLDGVRYLYVLVTGRPQVILRAEIPQGTCTKCHSTEQLPVATDEGVKVAHTAHYEADVECRICHEGFHNDVTQGSMPADLRNCTECHSPSVLTPSLR